MTNETTITAIVFLSLSALASIIQIFSLHCQLVRHGPAKNIDSRGGLGARCFRMGDAQRKKILTTSRVLTKLRVQDHMPDSKKKNKEQQQKRRATAAAAKAATQKVHQEKCCCQISFSPSSHHRPSIQCFCWPHSTPASLFHHSMPQMACTGYHQSQASSLSHTSRRCSSPKLSSYQTHLPSCQSQSRKKKTHCLTSLLVE